MKPIDKETNRTQKITQLPFKRCTRQTIESYQEEGNHYDKRRISIGADCQIKEGIPRRRLYAGLQPGMEASGKRAPGRPVYRRPGECSGKGSL